MSAKNKMDLVLVRHGESEANCAGIIQGRGDYRLSPRGRDQAALTATALEDFSPSRIYSSPLLRASETAQIINQPHNVKIIALEDMVEFDLGEFEGLTGDQIVARYPNIPEDMKKGIPFHHLAPGAETDEQARARATRALAQIIDSGLPRVIAVAHLGILEVMIKTVIDKYNTPLPSPRKGSLGNCSITRIRIDSAAAGVICVNEVAHLE